jgi:CubicO group peptidase (beta-lactamase class C family)
MRRFLASFSIAVVAVVACVAVIVAGTIYGWWRDALAPREQTADFVAAATAKLEKESGGNAAFVLVEDGQIASEHYLSRGAAVDRDTRFQVASLSKWATAWGVMTLVEKGAIDLDAPVSTYLRRWQLPASAGGNEKVTARRLLSHTAGLTDGLGYGGFAPGQPVQTLEESLTRASDASPGADGAVKVGMEPGSRFAYSGGGYALLQLIIEEVSGQSFNDYMTRAVFAPLGMTRSTYSLDDAAENVAESYDTDGSLATRYRFSAPSAAGLYTSAGDMARFIQAHTPGRNGEPIGRGVLRPDTVAAMRAPHASQWGAAIWGLGVILYAENGANDFVIGHDGMNEPAINTSARLDPDTGDGIVVLETGNELLATELASEWVFWNTGNVDFLTVASEMDGTLRLLAIAGSVTFLLTLLLAWRMTRGLSRKQPSKDRATAR